MPFDIRIVLYAIRIHLTLWVIRWVHADVVEFLQAVL